MNKMKFEKMSTDAKLWSVMNVDNYIILHRTDPRYYNMLLRTLLIEHPKSKDYTWYLDAGYGDIDFDGTYSLFFLMGYEKNKEKNSKRYSQFDPMDISHIDLQKRERTDCLEFIECCGRPDICVQIEHEEEKNGVSMKIFENIMKCDMWIDLKRYRAENNVYMLLNYFNDNIELLSMSRIRPTIKTIQKK
jgi:hypothetical protein